MTIAWRRGKLAGGGLPGRAIGLGLVAGLFIFIGYLCAPARNLSATPTSAPEGTPTVRVRLLARATTVQIDVDGKPLTVGVGDVVTPRTFDPQSDGRPIAVDGRRFRGQIRLAPNIGGTTFDVVNIVSIDDYLRGVVPSEMFPKWPADALKAQAIAARTFALYQSKSREAVSIESDEEGRGFDLHADVRSQAYKGVDNEAASSNAAVDETRGLVLAAGEGGNEKIFPAYFSNTCGGITTSGADYDEAMPPLIERLSDGCVDAPKYRWPEFSIRKDELTRRVRIWGQRQAMAIANCGQIRSVEISARNSLGRPSKFVLVDDVDRRYTLSAEKFRNACNADGPKDVQFLSSFFTPVDAGDSLRITDGRGWGHGVGLCQYCALGWSKKGQDYKQILSTSYPSAVLVRAY